MITAYLDKSKHECGVPVFDLHNLTLDNVKDIQEGLHLLQIARAEKMQAFHELTVGDGAEHAGVELQIEEQVLSQYQNTKVLMDSIDDNRIAKCLRS